jgi:hypothetical protein
LRSEPHEAGQTRETRQAAAAAASRRRCPAFQAARAHVPGRNIAVARRALSPWDGATFVLGHGKNDETLHSLLARSADGITLHYITRTSTGQICQPRPKVMDHCRKVQSHRHQHQQENEESVWPIFRICAACSSVRAASCFFLSSAASLFASALWLTSANLLVSLSCSRAFFLSILA